MTLRNCVIYGVKKGSNGFVNMERCVVRGSLQISGNNKVDLKHCVVLGEEIAIDLSANASLEAKECFIAVRSSPSLFSTISPPLSPLSLYLSLSLSPLLFSSLLYSLSLCKPLSKLY